MKSSTEQFEGGIFFPALGAFIGEVFCLEFSPAFFALELHVLSITNIRCYPINQYLFGKNSYKFLRFAVYKRMIFRLPSWISWPRAGFAPLLPPMPLGFLAATSASFMDNWMRLLSRSTESTVTSTTSPTLT